MPVVRKELDDPGLARAVQAGDGAAISRVLELCVPSLRPRLVGRLGLSAEDCEDLLQEVRVAFLAAATRFRGECSLRTFLSQIACYKCTDYLRARRRRDRNSQRAAGEPASRRDDPMLGEALERLAVTEAMAQLTPRERQVLELYYLQERSYQEISAVMGIGTGSIGALKAEALLKLRTAISDEGGSAVGESGLGERADPEVTDESPA